MAATYDVFLSHAWADGERPQQIANALTQAGLRVWFDANEINDFASITAPNGSALRTGLEPIPTTQEALGQLSPMTPAPLTAPFFCCDQDAIHDHGRDVSIYSILFINSLSSPTTGAVRLYVRNAANTGNSCTYTIDPGAGNLLDYPHPGLGNNFLYLTANVITNGNSWTGARRYRLNLDQMATCVSATTNTITSSGRRVHCLQSRE